MPASTGDPISAALSHSLAASSKLSSDSDTLDTKLIGSTKRVLLTEIKYEQTSTFNSNLEDLKSKYVVLKPNVNSENGEVKLKNGLPKPALSDSKPLQSSSVSKASSSIVKPSSPAGVNKAVLPSPKRVLFDPEKIQLGWQTKTVPVGAGMENLGNTCYLNSTLQALFHVPAFVNWLLNDKAHKDKCEALNGLTHTDCLICAMLKTLKSSLENSASNSIRPHLVYNKLKLICKRLMHGHQEDAHEFMRYLIESMDRSYLRIMQANNLDSYSKETTPLSQIFGGYLRTEVRCLECRNISLTFQHFQDLLLDIRQATTLDQALESYFTCERLGDGDEAYKCEKCHRRVAATKKFTVEKPPNVLCIQLKRFGITGGKNSKHIQLQTSLDLTRFWVHQQSQPGVRLNYRLVSLVNHIGPSTNCGHYTAVGLASSGQFYLFDDSLVRLVSTHSVSGNNTYIIMYELTSPNPSLNSAASKVSPPNGTCTVTKPSQNTSTVVGCSNGMRRPISPITNGTSNHSHSQPTTPLKSMLGSPLKTANSSNAKTSVSSHKSLVPYSTESSDSESEPATSKKAAVTLPTSSPIKNGFAKESSSFVKFSNCSIGASPNKTSTRKSDECKSEVVVNGWHVTEVVEKRSVANSLYNPPQNWAVISVDTAAAKSAEKNGEPSQLKVEESHNGINGKDHKKPVENGHSTMSNGDEPKKATNGSVENGRISNGKSWDGCRNNSTVDYLKKNSHQGYGRNVTTWNGGRTQVDEEAEMDRLQQRKRSYDQMYEDEMDHGKVKKVKNNYYQKNDREINGRRNYFQEHQNHKNNGWYKDRHHFYRTYSNNHHRTYQNNNNRHQHYNPWRR
ncbi:ubiquitin carboxyl-terminal hydrolase 36-like isoform X1 [Macrosteles quadrilineatus]|uniref:ubiquitin carboxyl-terminal hydrolase 36-like isoform X1 n=1 Tax=Macrosteles quadrilineatus TaxID=74068 RepID=UPI0023E1452C|nr:ubiquitin carboxyl-terminal hydrolase 36-like isoform X1 [Macrosteles quadrilineatus]